MCSSRRIAQLSALMVALLFLVACGGQAQLEPTVSPAESTAVAQTSQMGPITPFGGLEVRDLSPTSEVVPNCDGVTSPVVKHPSMTVGSSHTVEWQVGGSVGTGVTIGGGVVPGGVDLQATLEGHVANDLTNSIQQSNAWDLPADPGTIMEYTIMWREVWQPAYLDITFMGPEPKIIRIDVKYRTGVQSDIVGQKVTLCDPGAAAQPGTDSSIVPPTATAQGPSQPKPAQTLCAATVTRADVQNWAQVGMTDKATMPTYINEFRDKMITGSGFVSGFNKGDTIPVGILIATDFGNGESEDYLSFPVNPVVHYRSWGLFEVTDGFVALNADGGWCATIR